MKLDRIRAAALVAAAAVACASRGARAQTFGSDGTTANQSPQNFALELRVGAYLPNIDSHFSPNVLCPAAAPGASSLSSPGPFWDIFSTRNMLPAGATASQCDARSIPLHPLVAAEFDWQILRLGPIGSFGVGLSAGFASLSAQAPTQASMQPSNYLASWSQAQMVPPTGCADNAAAIGNAASNPNCWLPSAETTTLDVIPITALAVFRFDGLARRIPWLPIVPYIKAGLNYSLWFVYKGPNLSTGGCMPAVTSCPYIAGGTLGWHAAVGVAVMLDAFEPRAARQLDANSGINHTYFFGEVYTDQMFLLNHGAAPFDVGTYGLGPFTWTFGLTFEL